MRILLILAIVGVAAAVQLSPGGNGITPATACSFVSYPFDDDVRRATFAGIIDTSSVGDGTLREPPLPTRTPEPESVTSTPEPTTTSMPPEAAATVSAAPPLASPHYTELVGQSAHAVVIEQIGGSAQTDIDIDLAARRNYERGIRQREAGYGLTSCSLIPAPLYETGTRYLVVLNDYDQSELWTVRRFEIVGSEVLLSGGYLDFEESVYRRYFPGVAADIRDTGDGSGRRMAYITASRMPLDQLLAMMRDVRIGIRPPETGNAGLAANRY